MKKLALTMVTFLLFFALGALFVPSEHLGMWVGVYLFRIAGFSLVSIVLYLLIKHWSKPTTK